jgi:anti-sigma B factor antagonist
MAGKMLDHTVRRHADGQTVTATVVGEWDSLADGTLIDELRALLDQGYRNIIVDAEQLSFCDSTALGALVGLHQQTVARGGWLRVAAPNTGVRRPIKLSGLDRVFDVYDSSAEAQPAESSD